MKQKAVAFGLLSVILIVVFAGVIMSNVSQNDTDNNTPVFTSAPTPPIDLYCGDGVCSNMETGYTCPSDCGVIETPFPLRETPIAVPASEPPF